MDTGDILTNPCEIDETSRKYFSTLLNGQIDSLDGYQLPEANQRERDEIRDEIITIDEVQHAIRFSKSGKAPGTDIISNEILQAGKPLLPPKISEMFSLAYKSGRIPSEEAKSLYALYTRIKETIRHAKTRGITLLNHITKLYETILERKLKVLDEPQMGVWQHGFRPGKITTDMIFSKRRIMDKHWEFNQPLYVAFLDLEKAFDRVPGSSL